MKPKLLSFKAMDIHVFYWFRPNSLTKLRLLLVFNYNSGNIIRFYMFSLFLGNVGNIIHIFLLKYFWKRDLIFESLLI